MCSELYKSSVGILLTHLTYKYYSNINKTKNNNITIQMSKQT